MNNVVLIDTKDPGLNTFHKRNRCCNCCCDDFKGENGGLYSDVAFGKTAELVRGFDQGSSCRDQGRMQTGVIRLKREPLYYDLQTEWVWTRETIIR